MIFHGICKAFTTGRHEVVLGISGSIELFGSGTWKGASEIPLDFCAIGNVT